MIEGVWPAWSKIDGIFEEARCPSSPRGFRPTLLPATSVNQPGLEMSEFVMLPLSALDELSFFRWFSELSYIEGRSLF